MFEDDIKDNEIRLIGKPMRVPSFTPDEERTSIPHKNNRSKTPWKMLTSVFVGFLLIILICLLWKGYRINNENNLTDKFENGEEEVIGLEDITEAGELLIEELNYSQDEKNAYTEVVKDVINDIPISIYYFHNAVPQLCIGDIDSTNKDIIFASQAADIRADNRNILGEFVLRGEQIATGISKQGYCAIIDNQIFIGCEYSTELFQESIEKQGYFFRQYSLVKDGRLIENKPKNKSYRKALCYKDHKVFVIMSETKESYHDFSQVLVDYGVETAIYLVGGDSHSFYRDSKNDLIVIQELNIPSPKNRSYIFWVKVEE